MTGRKLFTPFFAGIGVTVVAIATVGGVLFSLLLFFTRAEDEGQRISAKYPSPQGSFRAVRLSETGGGAPSGYCINTIAVTPPGAPDKDASREENHVFVANCASFGLKDGSMKSSPRVEWLSDARLRITFSTEGLLGDLKRIKLRADGATRRVRVEFATDD